MTGRLEIRKKVKAFDSSRCDIVNAALDITFFLQLPFSSLPPSLPPYPHVVLNALQLPYSIGHVKGKDEAEDAHGSPEPEAVEVVPVLTREGGREGGRERKTLSDNLTQWWEYRRGGMQRQCPRVR